MVGRVLPCCRGLAGPGAGVCPAPPGRCALAFVLLVSLCCVAGTGFRLVSVLVAFGGLACSGLRRVWLLLFCSGWLVFLRGFVRLGCVLCGPVLLGRLGPLRVPLGFVLATFLPLPFFPLRASL
jgi:hypothetical protein